MRHMVFLTQELAYVVSSFFQSVIHLKVIKPTLKVWEIQTIEVKNYSHFGFIQITQNSQHVCLETLYHNNVHVMPFRTMAIFFEKNFTGSGSAFAYFRQSTITYTK